MKKNRIAFCCRGGRGLRLDKRGVFVVFVPLKVKLLLWECAKRACEDTITGEFLGHGSSTVRGSFFLT